MNAATRLLPRTIDSRVKGLSIASLVSQILIVGTGGAVRLTGSGLGCPTWPRCTEESFVATPEMGIHGAIEFGNRLLTFVLIIIAIAMFLSVIRMRRERPELVGLAVAIGLGIPAQGVVGGITVLTGLNPWIVGLHFVVSIVLVVLATVLVYRVFDGPKRAAVTVPRWYVIAAAGTSVLTAITIAVGIVTTGSGPHAGDGGAARNGLDPELLQHVHSWPAYAMLLGVLILATGAARWGVRRLLVLSVVLLVICGLQVLVGVMQARLGLPEILVGIHMVLACCLASAMTAVVLSLRSPRPRATFATA